MKIYRISQTVFTPQFTPEKNTVNDLALLDPQQALDGKSFKVGKFLADRILQKTKAGERNNLDYQKIVDFYTNRESLPQLPIIWFGNETDEKVEGKSIVGQFGMYTDKTYFLKLNRAFKDMPNTMIVTIRHEIEHAIDTIKNNYRTNGRNQHHKNFSRFERQYAHRESLKNAIEKGLPVSAIAIEHFNINVPDDYTRNGEYYVKIEGGTLN